MVEAPGGWVTGLTPPKNLPPIEDHLCAKFHPDLSSGLDFYGDQTYKHTETDIALYVLDYVQRELVALKIAGDKT